MTGRPSTSSSQSGLSSITSWWVGEAGHMLLGVLDINGALVSLTSLPSLWLRLHDEQTARPVVVVPVSIHGDTISRNGFVCGLWIYINFIKILVNIYARKKYKITTTYTSFSPFTTAMAESLLGIKVSVELSTEGLAGESLDVWFTEHRFALVSVSNEFSFAASFLLSSTVLAFFWSVSVSSARESNFLQQRNQHKFKNMLIAKT